MSRGRHTIHFIVVISCFCFLGGIILGEYWQYSSFFLLCVVSLSGCFVPKKISFFFFGFAALLFGVFWHTQYIPVIDIEESNVNILAIVDAEPDVRQDGVRYVLEIREGPYTGKRIYMKRDLYPRYAYGDVVSMHCRIEKPEPVETFRYDRYLGLFRVFLLCQHPSKIQVVDSGKGQQLFLSIFSLKHWFAKNIEQTWHEPYASFMAGLLYGYRGGLGYLNELFSLTGVTHIVAISGYNITIVSSLLIRFFTRIHILRQRAFFVVSAAVAIFVLFAGASASVVRAGIMGIIVLLAQYIGRRTRPYLLLLYTSVIMAAINPFVLRWDIGFQLSFLATIGLIYLVPLLEPLFTWIPNALSLRESFVTTIAATIATAPIISLYFGSFSSVAIIVNVLILWIIPAIMTIGFISILLLLIHEHLSVFFSWVAFFGMRYIVFIVEQFARVSFASVPLSLSTVVVYLYYAVLYIWIRRKRISL